MVSNNEALAILDKLNILFNTPSPGLVLDCVEIENNRNVLAALIIDEDIICLRSNNVNPRLLAHEYGHYLYHYYYGKGKFDRNHSEGWAQFFEVMWNDNQFNFLCTECGSTGPVMMLETGELQCLKCDSVYGMSFR